MGDVLHILPAITEACQNIPNLTIDWVVEEAFCEIASWHPKINKVIPIAVRRWRKNITKKITWKQYKEFKTNLQSSYYDLVIDAQGLLKSAIVGKLTNRSCLAGFNKNCVREKIASYFYQKKFWVDTKKHAVLRLKELFAHSLNYLHREDKIDFQLLDIFPREKISNNIILVHSASKVTKLWSIKKWQDLIAKFPEYNFQLPWGNAKELKQAKKIAKNFDNAQILPSCTLTELAQNYFSKAKALVGVDTGLSHLAAAIELPAVVLYLNTDPNLIGSVCKKHIHLKGSDIDPISCDDVQNSLIKLLAP